MSRLSPRQMFLLDEACRPISKAFGCVPYLVGTANYVDRGQFRDVDVRLILPEDQYDELREVVGLNAVTFLGLAIGEYLASRTGLPVDFQIQRRTEANAHHQGHRNPLGLRDLDDFKGDAAPEPDGGTE